MSDIVVRDIVKSFGEKRVLRGFSCVFKDGETTSLMGSSGCGKTTLLNILMGLEKPNSGAVSGLPERIGCVFQEDRLCEDFSAAANVRLVCDRSVRDSDIERELISLGLSGSLREPVRTLSGGMRRRVALARAVMYGPELLLLDEACKGLDDETKAVVIGYIKDRCRGVTVINVTHDASEAESAGARTLVMKAE